MVVREIIAQILRFECNSITHHKVNDHNLANKHV